jgi:hypothetical protein
MRTGAGMPPIGRERGEEEFLEVCILGQTFPNRALAWIVQNDRQER